MQAKHPKTAPKGSEVALEARISRVGRALIDAVAAIFAVVPGGVLRPADVTRVFAMNKDMASRLLIAMGKRDTLAALYYMPGPEAFRKLVQSARRRGMKADLVANLDLSVNEFEELVREQGGNRGSLGAIISAWVPEARSRFESESKQALFKAMTNLRGCAAQTMVQAAFIHPSAEAGRVDGLGVVGYVGLRRVRPGAPIHISTLRTGPGAEEERPLTITGEPVDALTADMLLREFCSVPTPELVVRPAGNVSHYLVAGDRVGMAGAIDLFLGEFTPRLFGRTAPSPGRRNSVAVDVEICAEELVFDILVHKDVWPGAEPELMVYDTSMLGRVNPNDPERDIDRIDVLESLVLLGRGVQVCRVPGVARYVEMLRSVCSQRGWDADDFRCYRCHFQHPIYGTQIHAVWAPDHTRS